MWTMEKPLETIIVYRGYRDDGKQIEKSTKRFGGGGGGSGGSYGKRLASDSY